MSQLSLFDKPEESLTDKLMSFLEKMNQDVEKQNRELQAMIDEIQKDFTDEEKLQINPKEYGRLQKLKEQPKEESMKELTTEAISTLQNCTVDGLVVRLPEEQLDRKTYLEVKGRLELIGGKWKGGKVGCFVFMENPSELLEEIANGGSRNLKKEYQFFATPDDIADELVGLADLKEDDRVLEPSAGQGAIVKAINRVFPAMIVETCEAMSLNQTFLQKVETAVFVAEDFLELSDQMGYDKIIANPPFSKNQDIDHVRKMYELCAPGGRIVSIASKHWQLSSNRKETDFRDWLADLGAEIINIDSGKFKSSGTMVATCILVINKK